MKIQTIFLMILILAGTAIAEPYGTITAYYLDTGDNFYVNFVGNGFGPTAIVEVYVNSVIVAYGNANVSGITGDPNGQHFSTIFNMSTWNQNATGFRACVLTGVSTTPQICSSLIPTRYALMTYSDLAKNFSTLDNKTKTLDAYLNRVNNDTQDLDTALTKMDKTTATLTTSLKAIDTEKEALKQELAIMTQNYNTLKNSTNDNFADVENGLETTTSSITGLTTALKETQDKAQMTENLLYGVIAVIIICGAIYFARSGKIQFNQNPQSPPSNYDYIGEAAQANRNSRNASVPRRSFDVERNSVVEYTRDGTVGLAD